jgi:hypothetical protein
VIILTARAGSTGKRIPGCLAEVSLPSDFQDGSERLPALATEVVHGVGRFFPGAVVERVSWVDRKGNGRDIAGGAT